MIRGEGIGLRVPVPADRERWLELLHDPEQTRFGTPVFITLPETVDELDERIAEAAASFEAGEPTTLTIVEGDDPRFVGNIGVAARRSRSPCGSARSATPSTPTREDVASPAGPSGCSRGG